MENPIRLAATVQIVRDGADGLETLMLQRPPRGSFPSAWVFPGGAVDPEDGDARADEQRAARTAAAREVREEAALHVEPDALVLQAKWSPPEEASPRFRTWFFVAPEFSGTPVAAEAEAVALAWVRPSQMLRRHGVGEATLVVPTWVTLHGLAEFASVKELLASLATRTPEHFHTHYRDGNLYCWHGDARYDDPAGTGPARHRVDGSSLPWRYERSG